MGRLFRNMSLAGQIFAVTGVCLVITAGAALVAARTVGGVVRLELIGLLCAGSIVSIGIVSIPIIGRIRGSLPDCAASDWLRSPDAMPAGRGNGHTGVYT